MAENRKGKLYAKYVSTHNANLYRAETLNNVRSQFPVWDFQYGRFLPQNKNARVVDLGCGNGGLVLWLKERGFNNAEGVDISEEQIELGKKIGVESLTRGDLLEFLKDKEDYFDLIFIRDTLGHFNKDEVLSILEAIHKALAPEGRVLIKVPNAESPMTGRLRHGDFTHDTSFTGQSLEQLLSVHGFRNIRVESMRPVPHGFVSAARLILWYGIEALLRLYRLVEAGSSAGHFTQNILASAQKG